MSNVCLVIIFNHRFDANIERLEKIYKDRFSHIKYIVPFYDGDRDDVIPVYECSFRFSGYVAQAYEKFAGDFEHYFFIADDITIHPAINESNYEEWFEVNDSTSYIPMLEPIGKLKGWPFCQWFMDPERTLYKYLGTNWKNEIMSSEEAFAIAEKKGFERKDFGYSSKDILKIFRKQFKKYPRLAVMLFKPIFKGPQILPYPMWGKYCDIFIIPGQYMKKMARYFGIFAGMNLYVEIAIPTGIALISEKISTADNRKEKPLLLWGAEARKNLVDKYEGNYSRLVDEWDDNTLFIHPTKLSEWR